MDEQSHYARSSLHTPSSRASVGNRDQSISQQDDMIEGPSIEAYQKTLETLQKLVNENAEFRKQIRILESQVVPASTKKGPEAIKDYGDILSPTKVLEDRKMLKKVQAENQDLRREIGIALSVVNEARTEVEELRKKLRKNEFDIQAKYEEDLRAARQQQRSEVHELTSKIQLAERSSAEEKKKLQEDRDHYLLKCDALKSDSIEMRAEVKKAREDRQRFEETIENLKMENEILMKKLNQLTAENLQLSEAKSKPMASLEKVEALNQEIKTLKQKLRERAASISNLPNQTEFNQLLRDKKDLESRVNSQAKLISMKDSRCEQLERDITLLKQGIHQMKQTETDTNLLIENLRSEIDSLTIELKRTYQSLREVASAPTDYFDAMLTDRGASDPTRSKKITFSEYNALKKENALLKMQISENRRMQVRPVDEHIGIHSLSSTMSYSTKPGKQASAMVKDLEDIAYSLPGILQASSAMAHPGSSSTTNSGKSGKRS